jgi:serine/threonine protein kinase
VGQMSHPNIVQVFDAGQTDGELWLVMEYVSGPNLQAVMSAAKKRRMPVPLGVACRIMAGVCAGLAHAHGLTAADGTALGVVHRDLSPDNVMIDPSGNPKVTDFGIAKVKDSQVTTAPGLTRGKFRYMSPEQLLGTELNDRADIFVAGLLLYKLISGRHPFVDAATGQFASNRMLEAIFAPLRTLRAEVPDELEALVARAMAAAPSDRFPSCKAMKAALEQFIRAFDGAADQDVADFISQLKIADPLKSSPMPILGRSKSASSKAATALVLAGVGVGVLALTGAWFWRQSILQQAPSIDAPVPMAPALSAPVAVAPAVELEPQEPDPSDAGLGDPEPVKKNAPADRVRFGVVQLRVRPPARVVIDGKPYGETPLKPLRLTVGKHKLHLKNEQTDRTQTLEVRAGEQTVGITLP